MLRILGNLFGIKPNEWESVWYFFLIVLVFSIGSSMARSIGMALLVEHLGGEVLPKVFILIDTSAMFGFIAYAHFTKRINGNLILGVFFLGGAAFAVIARFFFWLEYAWVYGLFFIGFFVVYVMISIHIGSVVAAYFSAVQLKRVTGFINAGFPIGGVLGGGMLIVLLEYIAAEWLVLMLAVSYVGAFGLLRMVDFRLSPVRAQHTDSKSKKSPLRELNSAFFYIINSRLMLFMTIGLILFVISSKLMEYQYQALIYPEVFPDSTDRARFFAFYDIFANLAWLFIQLFFTSRILMWLGVGPSNVIHPLMMSGMSLALLFNFGFITGFFAQFINQEMRMGLRTPANNMLFNAIPPNMWGATKAFLNGIAFPLATVVASFLLLMLKDGVPSDQLSVLLPLFTLVFSVLGVVVAFPQWAAYNNGVFGLLNRTLFARKTKVNRGESLKEVLEEKLQSEDPQHAIIALGMIRVLELKGFVHPVGRLLQRTEHLDVKQHCLETLSTMPGSDAVMLHLLAALKSERDPNVLALLLRNLSQYKIDDYNLREVVEKFLLHPDPSVFAETCLCLYHNPGYGDRESLEDRLLQRVQHPDLVGFPQYLTALGQLRQADFSHVIVPYLDHPRPEIGSAAFAAYIDMMQGHLDPHKERFIEALESPSKDMKIAALRALRECSPPEDWTPVMEILAAKDRAVVNECKELLRLNLNSCKSSLIEQVFQKDVPVQEKFEILSLVYPRFSTTHKDRLRESAEHSLEQYIRARVLYRLYQEHAGADPSLQSLTEKALREIAENHLLHVLTAITFLSNESLEFFQRLSRGLQSDNKANLGNALEVLSNANERELSARLLKVAEERNASLEAIGKVYQSLFERDLDVTAENFMAKIYQIKHSLLRACLHYAASSHRGTMRQETRETLRLLGA